MALMGKVPRGTLAGKMRERNSDFGISVNEMTVKVGEPEEGLNVLDFSGFRPILDYLDFVLGHGEAFGRQHISEVFAGSDMELAFVCTGKNSISTESAKYFSDMSLVFGNVVRVDEDVVQIDDDNDINHVREDVVHKPLESCWSISKPFRNYQPLEGSIASLECSLPFVS